jgi:hypothetical protein
MSLGNSQLITIFKRMEKSEFYDFSKFIRCKYHNQRQQVVILFDYFKKYYPKFEHSKFSKEEAFKKLFPEQKFIAKKVNNVMYYLGELLDKYLIFQELEQSPRHQKQLMVEALKRKTLDQSLYKHLDKWKKELLLLPLKSPETYFDLQYVNKQRFFYINTDKRNPKETSFEETLKYSDEYFVAEKLRNAFYTSLRNKSLNKSINIELVDIAQEYLSEKPLDNPVLDIYRKIIQLNAVPNHIDFLAVKGLILKHIDALPTVDEKIDWITFINNYSIFQKSKGNIEYIPILFESIEMGIEKGFYYEKGVLNTTAYINLILMASNTKKAIWLEKFISEKFNNLSIESQENLKTLSEILLEYAKDNLENTIYLLNNLELSHFGLNLVARTLKIKCFFELEATKGNYYDALIHACDAHEKYVRRHEEIPNVRRHSNLNFIKLVKEVIQKKALHNGEKTIFVDKIKNTETIAKDWLLMMTNTV